MKVIRRSLRCKKSLPSTIPTRSIASQAGPEKCVRESSRSLSTSSRRKSEIDVLAAYPNPIANHEAILMSQRPGTKTIWRRQPPSKNVNCLELDDSLHGYKCSDIFHEMMIRHQVSQVFGYTGGAGVPIFDSVIRSKEVKTIFPRHEQGAGHMAEGYARASGKPGVVIVTSDSAATNLVTPMQDALCDGTPMVVFSGEVPTHSNGMSAFREADILGISKSCTKWNVSVRSLEELPQRINEAFEIAMSGRPGPVLVDLPKHLGASILDQPVSLNGSIRRRLDTAAVAAWSCRPIQSLDHTLNRVAHLVNIAKKPILYVGQGMLARPEGSAILKEFSDRTSIPVTTSLQGLGAFDELDPKALNMLGLHGAAYANLAIQNADLIIALGARFDDRVTGSIPKFAPQALLAARESRGGIVHFDIAPKNINKVVEATEAVQGDCATNLALLIPRIDPVADRPEWFAQIEDWKARFPLAGYKNVPPTPVPGLIQAQAVIEKLSDMTAHMKDRTLIATGVGQHQMWVAQHFRWRFPRTMLTSGGLGTMGYGLPAAIGAKAARPECLVIDVDGDASFNMTMQELITAAQYRIGIKVLLFNNEQMGMVSDLQRLYYDKRFVHNRQTNPDFVKVSQAFGVEADRCTDPADVEAKLRWLLDCEGPAVLEVVTEQTSSVWPVVPAGKGLQEFITYPEVKTIV